MDLSRPAVGRTSMAASLSCSKRRSWTNDPKKAPGLSIKKSTFLLEKPTDRFYEGIDQGPGPGPAVRQYGYWDLPFGALHQSGGPIRLGHGDTHPVGQLAEIPFF